MTARQTILGIALASTLVLGCVATAQCSDMPVYFTHPYGGIYVRNSAGQIGIAVPPEIGRFTGLTLDDSGNLYSGRYGDHRIDLMKMLPDRQVVDLGTIIEVTSVSLTWDVDLLAKGNGEVYFTHPYGGIFTTGPDGQISTISEPASGRFASLSFGEDESIYSAAYGTSKRADLSKVTDDNDIVDLGTLFELGSYSHIWDIDLAANGAGDIYFTHPYGGIHKMSPGGQVSTVVHSDVGRTTGLAFDDYENLYFAVLGDHRADLMKMTPDRQVVDLGTIVEVEATTLIWDTNIVTIPEPSSMLLLLVGAISLFSFALIRIRQVP